MMRLMPAGFCEVSISSRPGRSDHTGPDLSRYQSPGPTSCQVGAGPRVPAPANRESGPAPIPGQIGTQIGAGNRGVTSLSG